MFLPVPPTQLTDFTGFLVCEKPRTCQLLLVLQHVNYSHTILLADSAGIRLRLPGIVSQLLWFFCAFGSSEIQGMSQQFK